MAVLSQSPKWKKPEEEYKEQAVDLNREPPGIPVQSEIVRCIHGNYLLRLLA
jgi:hypothetical protein